MSDNMLRTMDGNSREEAVTASSLKFEGRENLNVDPTEVAAPCSAGHLIFDVGDDDNSLLETLSSALRATLDLSIRTCLKRLDGKLLGSTIQRHVKSMCVDETISMTCCIPVLYKVNHCKICEQSSAWCS